MNIERECRDENVFLKVEVTLRKFNSHLQYDKIDSSFNSKLQEINLNVRESLEHSFNH